MMKNIRPVSLFLIGVVMFVVGLVVGARFVSMPAPAASPVSSGSATSSDGDRRTAPMMVTIPKNDFDEVESIPGTSVKVAFPKKGLYGLGAELDERFASPAGVPDSVTHSYGSFTLQSTASASGSIATSLQVSATKRTTDTTLQEVAQTGSSIVTINGHEFLVYKDPFVQVPAGNGVTSAWHALSFGKKEIVDMTFWFSAEADPTSQALFRNDDQLFFQILSHLQFE